MSFCKHIKNKYVLADDNYDRGDAEGAISDDYLEKLEKELVGHKFRYEYRKNALYNTDLIIDGIKFHHVDTDSSHNSYTFMYELDDDTKISVDFTLPDRGEAEVDASQLLKTLKQILDA